MRRAVASIDTGSLAARRRIVDVPRVAQPAEAAVAAGPVTMPGRVAVRADSHDVMSQAARGHVSGTSVFDNLPPIEPINTGGEGPVEPADNDANGDGEPQRASALRRLIGSLRRR